jgi:hypothetical protein
MYPNIFLFLLLFFIPFIRYLCDSFFSFIVVKVGILSLASPVGDFFSNAMNQEQGNTKY